LKYMREYSKRPYVRRKNREHYHEYMNQPGVRERVNRQARERYHIKRNQAKEYMGLKYLHASS
jgi:hypothetical protein